ncbi:FAD/NAD(P)-binding protein [Streptococcus agalactiae]
MKKTIGIIGMGVSGLAVLLALSRKKEKELKQLAIFCFDDTVHFGRGIPFQEDVDSALINSPINDISFDYRHMSDFMDWLEENYYDTNLTYVSRTLYGQYLSERTKLLLDKLPVTVIKTRVDKLNYLSTVAIIGTGLAAIDVIKWLLLNTQSSVKAFSRTNYFPSVRIVNDLPLTWHFFTNDNLKAFLSHPSKTFTIADFNDLMSGELEHLGFKNWKNTTETFLSPGIDGLKLAFKYPKQLYLLQQLASRITVWLTDLWPLMSLSDKKEYKALYGKAIINLRNPMPDESAKVILKAAQKGTFSLINNVKTITKNDEGFSIEKEKQNHISVDRVINATGYQLNTKNWTKANPLLKSLINQEFCQIDDQGGITILTENAQVLSPKYGPMPGLYAHGALVNGVVYQNNSTIKIQQMAERAFSDNK